MLGSDTIGVCLGKVLEKPLGRDHALTMWRLMSGREHQVMTAVAVCSPEREAVCRVVGLPMAQTAELLNQFQVPWWGHPAGVPKGERP